MRVRLVTWIGIAIVVAGCARHAMTKLEGTSTIGHAAPSAPDAGPSATDAGAP